VNNDVEFVSLNKKEEEFAGFTPELVRSLINLKNDKSKPFTSVFITLYRWLLY
jgi:hypothetical protein